jgi:hypothetical protein
MNGSFLNKKRIFKISGPNFKTYSTAAEIKAMVLVER